MAHECGTMIMEAVHLRDAFCADSLEPEAPDLPVKDAGEPGQSAVKQLGADGHVSSQAATTTVGMELSGNQQQNTQQDGSLAGQAGASTEGSGDADVFSDEQVDAIKAALRPKAVQRDQQKQQSKRFWGYITDYITGADKLIQ